MFLFKNRKKDSRRIHVVSHGGWLSKETYFFDLCHVIECWPLSGWSNTTSNFSVTMLVSHCSPQKLLLYTAEYPATTLPLRIYF